LAATSLILTLVRVIKGFSKVDICFKNKNDTSKNTYSLKGELSKFRTSLLKDDFEIMERRILENVNFKFYL
jgi:hypothetical protein